MQTGARLRGPAPFIFPLCGGCAGRCSAIRWCRRDVRIRHIVVKERPENVTMEQPYLRSFEAQCTQEEPPGCQTMCPLHVEVRTITGLMAEGKVAEARKALDRTMPLSGLMGYLCDGDCMPHCKRAAVDEAVNMPLLERACVSGAASARTMAMPSTGKRIAVAGSGLSSLVFAAEMAKKGHLVTVFHTSPLGGRMLFLSGEKLPAEALPAALQLLSSLRVVFEAVDGFSVSWCDSVLTDNAALYIGLDVCPDGQGLVLADFGLTGIKDFLTQETAHPRVFAGGLLGGTSEFTPLSGHVVSPSFVREAADGKRASGSVIRLMQGVAPASAREKEGVYPTLLFTDTSGKPVRPAVVPHNVFSPTPEEARNEAGRCLQCQCLECVKRCAYLAHYKGYPKKYAREIYNNLAMVHGIRRTNTQIDSCALCGLCAAVCPNSADMGAYCFTARREMVTSRRMPVSAHEFALEDMAFSNDADIAFFRHQPGTEASAWAFFPGCQLPASMPDRAGRVYAYLCAHLNGGVGLFFHCCGAPARWSGRAVLSRDSAALVRKGWEEAGRPAMILACPSCVEFFAAELADIPALSLWDVLADLPLAGIAASLTAPLALHDPCAARECPSTRESVRKLLRTAGQKVEELELGRELTRCCGYGGLADAANPAMGERYAKSRADDTEFPLIAWCAMCRDRLRAVGKPCLHLLDILFGDGNPALDLERPAPGISLRQEQRLAFRRHMLHSLWQEAPVRDPRMESISLSIDDDVARRLEVRRILHSDLKAVLIHAEDTGALFVNTASGRSLASLRPKQVTYWVEYSKAPDGSYVIHDAYCHRMVVPGVPGEGRPTAVILEGHDPMGGRV